VLAIGAATFVGAVGVGRVGLGFWIEQAHPDQPRVVVHALDRVAVEL
jgi:hypothetical protein